MKRDDDFYRLWKHIHDEHGLTLLDSELYDIMNLASRAALNEAINSVLEKYPDDIFPKEGDSLDCKSAELVRLTCENIKEELHALSRKDNITQRK